MRPLDESLILAAIFPLVVFAKDLRGESVMGCLKDNLGGLNLRCIRDALYKRRGVLHECL